MSLFPESAYFSAIDKHMQDRIQSFKNDNLTFNRQLWQEQLIDTMFEAGDQTLWTGFFLQYPNMNKPMFNFNQLRRIKQTISGRQRQHRRTSVVVPFENANDETADQYTKLLLHNNAEENVLETYSDAFDQALTTGLSLLHLYMDYREDPISGSLKVSCVDYSSFVLDTLWRKPDFSDCNGIWRRTFVTPQELATLLPRNADLECMSYLDSARDGTFNYMPEVIYASKQRNLLAYDEFYYRDYRDATILLDPETGDQTEWNGTKDELHSYISYYPQIQVTHTQKPTVKLAITVNGRVAYDDRSIIGIDKYPFVPVLGYFNPAISDYRWKIQGVIRSLRDSAFLFNRVNVLLLSMLESKINTGWIYVDGKVVNPMDTYKTGEGQNIVLKPGSVIGQDIAPIIAQEIPSSYFQILENLGKNPEKISGVNEELLGSAVDDKAGVLSMLRQGAGLTTLQILFDQLDRSQKLMDTLRLEAIQANYTPGKVKRIIGEEPAPQFYNREFGKYSVTVQDGMLTSTQRQMQFAQLIQLKELGIQVPDRVLLESVTIQDKKKLIDAIEQQQQQQQQMQQQQTEIAMQELQSRAKLAEARTMESIGLAHERESRVPENLAMAEERKAAAIKDEEIALLNLVKALKEIDGLDMAHMQQAVALMGMIKAQENEVLQPGMQSIKPPVSKTPASKMVKKQPIKRSQMVK